MGMGMGHRRFILVAAALAIAGCYYVPTGGPAGASVKLARSLGSNVGQITLTVTGPGMTQITQTYTADSNGATIQIPSGIGRTFTVTADTPSATLSGSATVDLSPGESRTVVLDPKLSAAKIIVPDMLGNYRLAQLDDISGAGWATLTAPDFSATLPLFELAPADYDFDDQGRIYVANSAYSTYVAGVFRVDDIAHPSSYAAVDAVTGSFSMIAIDRKNGWLYYSADGPNSVYRKSLSSLSPSVYADSLDIYVSEPVSDSYYLKGMAVDDDGFIYLAAADDSTIPSTGVVWKYDPSRPEGSRIIATYNGLLFPSAVMVQNGYVIVADSGDRTTSTGQAIVRLDRNLTLVDSYGGPSSDPLWGPTRFVSKLGSGITVLDERYVIGAGNQDRLIFMEDMKGTGWKSYGSEGSGVGEFQGIWEQPM